MKKPVREIRVNGHELKVRGKGGSSTISVLEPVRGKIEVHRARGEFLCADWLPDSEGARLPVREDEVVFALEELDG